MPARSERERESVGQLLQLRFVGVRRTLLDRGEQSLPDLAF